MANKTRHKYKIFSIIVVIFILVLIFLLLHLGNDKFRNVSNTDLSNESVNGVHLMQKFDPNLIEKVFGKFSKQNDKDGYIQIIFNNEYVVGNITLDKDNNISAIIATTLKDSVCTNKGITTNKSSFGDIVKTYGENYLRENQTDPEAGQNMPSSIGYNITYIDKNNNFKMQFNILKSNSKDELQYIRLWKYK